MLVVTKMVAAVVSRLAARAQVGKLARTLDVPPSQLSGLEQIDAKALADYRVAVLDAAYTGARTLSLRLARLVYWLPAWLVAPLCRRRVAPLLAARVVGELSARRGLAIANRLPDAYLADICQRLDPRRAGDLIRSMPAARVVAIARVLIEREDYICASQFVDYLDDDTIRVVTEAVPDEAHLVRIAYYMESKRRLDHVVRILPRERLRKAILLVLDEERDLLLEVMSIVVHVSYALKRELGDLAAAQDQRVLNDIVRATEAHGLWPDLLPVVAALSKDSRQKVVNLPILRADPSILRGLLVAADTHELWGTVLPLLPLMQESMRFKVAELGAELSRPAMERVAAAAVQGEYWRPLFDIVARMDERKQREVAEIVRQYGDVDEQLYARVAKVAAEYGFGDYFDAVAA